MPLFLRHKKPGPLKPTANPYPSRVHQLRQKLGVITFFLLLIGGTALRFYEPFYGRFQHLLFESVSGLQGAFVHPFHETTTLLEESHTFMHLKEDYARLVSENEALKWHLQKLEPLSHENAVLREKLNIPILEQHKYLTARILSNPYDGFHHFFLIAAGEGQGLKKDQAVISPEGIVGRLEKVGHYVARVLLLNDVDSRIPVITTLSEQKAILAGDGSSFPLLVYVEEARKIQKGEKVVTSGLGGIFPAGLPVGVVEDIINGNIRVRPLCPFKELEWVHVLQFPSEEMLREINTALEESNS